MGIYSDVYRFAASAGAFEGYVYRREKLDPDSLVIWVGHLAKGYESLPPEVRGEFQDLCDGTIGRAIRSLAPSLSEDHEIMRMLKELVTGRMPSSPDDFHGEG